MLRTSFVKAVRPLAAQRFFTTSMRAMAGGDAGSGSSRPGGSRQGDAFTKRESASEEMYIKQEEKARLMAIKAQLQAQHKHIEELTKHIDEITNESAGQGEQPGSGGEKK